MFITLDTETQLEEHGCSYIASSQHRGRPTQDKSTWCIDVGEEIECFKNTCSNRWLAEFKAWGLKIDPEGDIHTIGNNIFREDLQLAKFVDSSRNQIWHGYPADYVRKHQDRPSALVLNAWQNLGVIKKHQASKIRSGKVCTL